MLALLEHLAEQDGDVQQCRLTGTVGAHEDLEPLQIQAEPLKAAVAIGFNSRDHANPGSRFLRRNSQ